MRFVVVLLALVFALSLQPPIPPAPIYPTFDDVGNVGRRRK